MNPLDQELACQYVLDQLSVEGRTAFAARVRSEPELAAQVRALERALEARITALPQRTAPADVWDRIEAELAGQGKADAGRGHEVRALRSERPLASVVLFRRWAMLGGIAAAVLVTLSVAIIRRLTPSAPVGVVVATLDQGNSTSRQLVLPDAGGTNAGARFVQLAALAEKLWQQPQPGESGNRGYALFDPSSREGFIGVQQAPALRPGQQYRLWVIDETSGEARDAGVLPMREANRGLYFFSLPQGGEVQGRLSFMVTAEPEQSVPAEPTGKVVLGRKRM